MAVVLAAYTQRLATLAATTVENPSPASGILCMRGVEYDRSFNDEFHVFHPNERTGGTWDTRYDWGRSNPGARDAAYYADPSLPGAGGKPLGIDPFHVGTDGLTITAARAPTAIRPYIHGLAYTSGLITTQHSFTQLYGYFEARIKLPSGKGLWPAFWMLPSVGYPPPEIDVMEVLGDQQRVVFQTTHAAGMPQEQEIFTGTDATDGAFHTYGVIWTRESVVFLIDGIVTSRFKNTANTPMFLLANLQVGGAGSWPGEPNAATRFPAEMTIAYMRAYRATGRACAK